MTSCLSFPGQVADRAGIGWLDAVGPAREVLEGIDELRDVVVVVEVCQFKVSIQSDLWRRLAEDVS